MRAIQVTKYGDANVLKITEVSKPKPAKDEALIQLKAAGLNFIDIYNRTGFYPLPLPFIPGHEGAGIVEEIGADVTEVKVGDRVAFVSPGTYAEYGIVKSKDLILLPPEISFDQGAAFPLQGMTAQYLLHEFYQIKPTDIILVHAAAGGVGLLLVQWIKHLGAKIIGTVSTEEKAKIVRAAGADEVILYSQEDFVTATKKITHGRGVDYIIDGVGKTTFTKDFDAVRMRGTICSYGSASGAADATLPAEFRAKSLTVSGGSLFHFLLTREELLMRANAVLEGILEGWLKLKIDYVYPLAEAAEAHQMLEGRKTTGKVILEISN